jgi:hypothetical protein
MERVQGMSQWACVTVVGCSQTAMWDMGSSLRVGFVDDPGTVPGGVYSGGRGPVFAGIRRACDGQRRAAVYRRLPRTSSSRLKCPAEAPMIHTVRFAGSGA